MCTAFHRRGRGYGEASSRDLRATFDVTSTSNRSAFGSQSSAEIAILKRIFSPDHARLALYLDYKLHTADQVYERAKSSGVSQADAERMLEEMRATGAIGHVEKEGRHYHTIPLVVGMWEYQAGRLTPELLANSTRMRATALSVSG